MKKVALIVVWYGKFPNYFDFWLESAKKNSNYDFLVFTDNIYEKSITSNIFFFNIAQLDMQKYISERLGFNINISKPYKLCDFKPCYGYIFNKYLTAYDYWGHIDIDVIYGNLDKFLRKVIEENEYDKILTFGHFVLYKNKVEINKRFIYRFNNKIDYKKILLSNFSYGFDEDNRYSICEIYKKKRFSYLRDINDFVTDINVNHFDFFDVKNDMQYKYFRWYNGSLFGYDNKNNEFEKGYVHFQKRYLKVECELNDEFYIEPNRIVSIFNDLNENKMKKIHYYLLMKRRKASMMLKLIKRKIHDEVF